MRISELESKINEKIPVLSSRIVEDSNVFRVIAAGAERQDEECYLAYTENLCGMNRDRLKGNLLWCGEKPEHFQEYSFNSIEVSPENYADAVSLANELLQYEYRFQNLHIRMMDILMKGEGMTALVDEMARSLNTTIAILDMSGKIVAQSHPFMIKDPLWMESIKRGWCPPFFIEHLRDLRTKSGISGSAENEPLLRQCIDNQVYYLAKRLYVSGELYGYAFMLQMTDKFSPFCNDVLNYIGNAATEYMLKNKNLDGVKSAFYDNLLIDIFHGISPDQIKARLFAGEMKFPPRMCIAAVKPRYFQGENYVEGNLSRVVQHLFPKERSVYFRKMIIVLFGLEPDAPGLSEAHMKLLESMCADEHVTVGISNPFSKVTSTKHYFNQAIRAIELSGRLGMGGDIHEYKDVALFDLINNDAENHAVGFYCHPALHILAAYDVENGSQLHDTLRSLAANGFNSSTTATELFLHRNTLAYRKQKIVSLTGLDLDDFNTQFMLKYSFMIEQYLQKSTNIDASL